MPRLSSSTDKNLNSVSNSIKVPFVYMPLVPSTFVTFTGTGSLQTWTVPAGVTRIAVWAWGAGGGAGNSRWTGSPTFSSALNGGDGAGGGAIYVPELPVTPAEVLYIIVGMKSGAYQNKSNGSISNGNPPAFTQSYPSDISGGSTTLGGAGGTTGSNGGWGGYGGDPSGIKRSSTWLLRAYGGGGGGGAGQGPLATINSAVNGPSNGAGGDGIGYGYVGRSFGEGAGGGGGGGDSSDGNSGSGQPGANGSYVIPAGAITYDNVGTTPGNTGSPRYTGTYGQGGTGSTTNIFGKNGYLVIGY